MHCPCLPSPFSTSQLLVLTAVALALACSAHAEPQPATPGTSAAPVAGHVAAPENPAPWWRELGGPELDELIRTALRENHDLRIAASRVAQARAMAGISEADRSPQLGLAAGARAGQDTAADPKTRVLALGFRASWEPDLFGRLAASGEAATADAQAAELERQGLEIAIAGEVATAYFDALTLSRRHEVAEAAVDSLERQVNVARKRFEAGQLTRLDIDRLESEWRLERAGAEQRAGEHRLRLQQLALLLGRSALPELSSGPREARHLPALPPVLDAELLARRPDVRQQARAADAAALRLGVARADLYPRIEFDWTGQRERLSILGGGSGSTIVIGYGVSLSLPLFDGGRIRANIAARDAQATEALQAYEKAMLLAVADAQSALQQYATTTASVSELGQAVERAGDATARARRLFEAGQIAFDSVLDAERSRLRAEDELAQAEGACAVAAVAVRRAFAGPV
jgi:multidrug efflux system outer membrane protein